MDKKKKKMGAKEKRKRAGVARSKCCHTHTHIQRSTDLLPLLNYSHSLSGTRCALMAVRSDQLCSLAWPTFPFVSSNKGDYLYCCTTVLMDKVAKSKVKWKKKKKKMSVGRRASTTTTALTTEITL